MESIGSARNFNSFIEVRNSIKHIVENKDKFIVLDTGTRISSKTSPGGATIYNLQLELEFFEKENDINFVGEKGEKIRNFYNKEKKPILKGTDFRYILELILNVKSEIKADSQINEELIYIASEVGFFSDSKKYESQKVYGAFILVEAVGAEEFDNLKRKPLSFSDLPLKREDDA